MNPRLARIQQMLSNKARVRMEYQRAFDGPSGEFVLKHLMKVGMVTESTFVKGDPYETAMNEGMRRLVLSILKQVNGTDRNMDLVQEQIQQHEDHMANPP